MGIELTRMTRADFVVIANRSPMSDAMKTCAYAVLVEGISVTAVGEREGISPSYVHRACRALLEYTSLCDGPASAFDAWYAARLVVAAPIVTPRGVTVPVYSSGPILRADLRAFEPEVRVGPAQFGGFMAGAGHVGVYHRGVTIYAGVRLADGAATPRGRVDMRAFLGHRALLDSRTGAVIPAGAVPAALAQIQAGDAARRAAAVPALAQLATWAAESGQAIDK